MPWPRRLGRLALVVGMLYAGYQVSNRFHLRPPAHLPLTALDRAVPLWEWTVWPYLALAHAVGLIALAHGRAVFTRAVRALLLGYPINLAIFTLFPTTYPRVEFVPGEGLTQAAFAFLFSVDTPANCFPSGHITAPLIGFWAVAQTWPRWRWPVWLAFAALCPTILTTKQHYAVDLAGGLVTAWFGLWASGRFFRDATATRPIPRPRFNAGLVNVLAFRRDPLRFLARLIAECGPVARCRLAWLDRVIVNDPALARAILELPHAAANKATRSVAAIARISGESVLTANGETWARLRRMVQPAFHRQQLAPHVATMGELARAMLADWRAAAARGEAIEVGGEMRRLTFRFIGKALFHADPSRDIAQLEAWITTAMDATWRSIQSPTDYALRLPTRRRREFEAAMAGIDGYIARVIAERRRSPASAPPDLLSMLLAVREPDGSGGLSDAEIRNECVTLMIAGYDTTANALAWALLEIARRPDLVAEVRAEADAVLGERLPALADVPRLRVARAVFLEALRLHPPIWILERNLVGPVSAAGWQLEAGAQVLMSPWTLHRSAAHWPRAEEFDPQRFLGDPAAGEDNPAFLPFGAGSRGCVGKPLALLEGTVFLAEILRAGTPRALSDEHPTADAGVSLRPTGATRVKFEAR